MLRHSTRLVATTVLLGACCGHALADDSFTSQEQVARLDALLTDPAAPPARLVELSRLLAEPKDQIVWLSVRAEALNQGDTASAAAELAKLAGARLDNWSKLKVAGLEPLKERLSKIGGTPPVNNGNKNGGQPPQGKLVDITDPAALAARLKNAQDADFAGLSTADKALLWSRGVPNSRLGLVVKGKMPGADWDLPRVLVFDLGLGKDSGDPLTFLALLARQDQLRGARSSAAAGPQIADATFTVTGELLSLALGLGSSAAAGSAAATLEKQNAWAWAALARIAEASAPGGNRAVALGSAREHLKSIQLVRQARDDGAAHIGTLIEKWIARVEGGGPPTGGDSIGAFDTSVIDARRKNKRKLAGDCDAAAPGDQKFKLMQQAKAAEVGFDAAPAILTIDELKGLLRNPLANELKPGIHLYLELLEVAEGRCIGLAVGSKTGGLDKNDDFVVKWLGPAASADSLVDEATRSVGFRDEATMIVAPDGAARAPGWPGESILVRRLKKNPTWVLYVPTAAALKKGSGWKPVDALRYFCYAGNNAASLRFKLSGAAPQTFGSPWLENSMGLIVVGLGADVGVPTTPAKGFCERLMNEKMKGGAAGVFVVGYSKERGP